MAENMSEIVERVAKAIMLADIGDQGARLELLQDHDGRRYPPLPFPTA